MSYIVFAALVSHKTSTLLVSGKHAASSTHTTTPAPAIYNWPIAFPGLARAAASGAMMLASRPQKLARPDAEPRTEAGKASGVHA
jgi:hypothetical protein